MLSGKGGLNLFNKRSQKQPPPPLPPKPMINKININCHDGADTEAVISWLDQQPPSASTYSSETRGNSNGGDAIESNTNNWKFNARPRCTRRDNIDGGDHQNNYNDSNSNTTNSKHNHHHLIKSTEEYSIRHRAKTATAGELFLHDSMDDGMATTCGDNYSSKTSTVTNKPIVTESPEEANNNIVTARTPAIRTSTVEILEVPFKQHKPVYGNNNNKPTFSRSFQQQRLFYENNSYATPVVTSATDDEEVDSDNDVNLPTKIEVESLINESLCTNPQRTSTPNASQTAILNSFETVDLDRTKLKTNINVEYIQDIGVVEQNEHDDDVELANSSRETDGLANGSVLNESGGCELIGIYENSDTVNSSGDSPRVIKPVDSRALYNMRMSNEIKTPSKHKQQEHTSLNMDHSVHSDCQNKIRELESFTSSLLSQVDSLKQHVESLTAKVEELEVHVDKQQVDVQRLHESSNRSIPNISLSKQLQPNRLSSPNRIQSQTLSQSTSTINRLTPSNGQSGVQSLYPSSTYSRNNVATISRNSNPPSTTANRLTLSHSCNNATTKSMKRNNVHASTNSLYGDGFKSGCTSISPTPNYQQARQSTSPNSLMSLSRREPMSYTSMLSLSSIGHSGASTLKKASAVSGSISNLSQVGSQLSQWPSTTDFLFAKHRAKETIYSEEERLVRMMLYNRLVLMRLPNWIGDDYNIDFVPEPPSVRLKLDWVYGYRGRDCRCNIFYLPTGECAYFVASIVVLYNPESKTQRHYIGHTDSVKCLAVHPNKLIIASGQSTIQSKLDKRPIVRVWNTVSLATLKVIVFNEDFDFPICCLAFSKHDQGATLAVVDESPEHTITLLDWQREKNWRLAETNSGHEAVLAIDFHPIDKYSLVAVGKSSINFWDIRGMTLTKKAGLFDKYDKPKYVLCLTFNDFGDTITGDSNGNLIIWPRGTNRPQRVIHDVHQGGVFSVLAMKDGTYLTGGRDRRILEWDEDFNRTGREAELPEHCGGVRYITYGKAAQVLIGTLRNCLLMGSFDTNFVLIMQGHTEATSSLAVHPTQSQFLTGGFDDQIHLFDIKTHDVMWSKCLMMPATAASFSPNALILVVGSTLGKWLVIDAISQEILFTKCDGSGSISCIKFSPNGGFFCLGSGDGRIYIYQTTETGNKFVSIGTCVGHSAPIKEIDWSDDSRYIQSQSMNLELLYWKALNCRPLDDSKIVDDLKWHTHNCTVGFSVIGLWSDSLDSSLINTCDKSNRDDLIISATDNGNINVFKWPPCYDRCLSHKYYGNVEKFNFIKFLSDDSRLIAVGAKNCVTTEWIVDRGDSPDM